MVNKVILVGRLGSDPELRYGQNGKPVAKFRVATDSGWGDNKQTEWHNVVCFDKTAENASKYLQKGRMVYVEGRITYRKWRKDDGTTTWFTDVLAREVQFLGSGDRGGSTAPPPVNSPAPPSTDSFDDGFSDDDIPF